LEPESFFVVSEFGVGLAGFSAVVVALGYRAQGLDPVSRLRVLSLLVNALLAAFGALLPQLFSALGFIDESVWRWSSAFLGVAVVAAAADTEVRRRRLSTTDRAHIAPVLYLTMMGVLAGIAVWQGTNLTSTSPSPGPVFSSLVLLLANSAIVFVRFLVARPSDASIA